MFDMSDVTNIGLALLACYTKYIHSELKDRPTREELVLRLSNIELKLDNMKEDMKEIKYNQERASD